MFSQPAHLAVAEGVAPTEADLPIRRARYVRKALERSGAPRISHGDGYRE